MKTIISECIEATVHYGDFKQETVHLQVLPKAGDSMHIGSKYSMKYYVVTEIEHQVLITDNGTHVNINIYTKEK